MKILRHLLLIMFLMSSFSMVSMAQKQDQRPPKDPPKINPENKKDRPKDNPPKNNDNRGKKP